METGGIGLEQLAQPGQPFAQFAGGRLRIEVHRHGRGCGRKGDAHRATAAGSRQHRARRAGGLDGMRGNRPGGGLPDQFDGEAGELAELADAGQRAAAGDGRAAGLVVAGDDALRLHAVVLRCGAGAGRPLTPTARVAAWAEGQPWTMWKLVKPLAWLWMSSSAWLSCASG
ncbi:hypothetical protein D3C75_1033410 [compost metagenome]